MIVLKVLAALLTLFTARTVVLEYKKYTTRKLLLADGFCDLLSFIKGELSCRLRPVAEWAKEFHNAALSESGFLDELLKRGSLIDAFRLPSHSCLGEEMTRLLSGYFSSFGKTRKRGRRVELLTSLCAFRQGNVPILSGALKRCE